MMVSISGDFIKCFYVLPLTKSLQEILELCAFIWNISGHFVRKVGSLKQNLSLPVSNASLASQAEGIMVLKCVGVVTGLLH